MTAKQNGTPSIATQDQAQPAPWATLSSDRQLQLRIAYGEHLDHMPKTCSLEEKDRRFADWLAARGVRYP